MKRLLSYVWPITRKVESKINGVLEVTWVNGQKVLDARNANYSYGTLQHILEIGLSKVDLQRVDSILLLGLGGGSIVASLLDKYNFGGKIVGVEIDEVVIEIAEREFQIRNTEQLEIVHSDAMDYVLQSKCQFQLVIVDLFIDNAVPEQFYSKTFCDGVRRIISESGYLIFNLGLNKIRSKACARVTDYFKEHPYFTTHLLENVAGYNLILIGERIDSDKRPFKMQEFPKM